MHTATIAGAIDGFERRLARVPADGWAGPTPCGEWDVRDLVNHVVGELLWVPPLLDGLHISDVGDRFDGDVLGDDPHATFAAAADGVRTAASQPGVLERIVHLSFGDCPGSDYLGQVTSDVVIHTWDLARAIGADDRLDPQLVAFVDGFLRPQAELWRSAGAFGAAVDAGGEAGAQDRLLALTGRAPNWTA